MDGKLREGPASPGVPFALQLRLRAQLSEPALHRCRPNSAANMLTEWLRATLELAYYNATTASQQAIAAREAQAVQEGDALGPDGAEQGGSEDDSARCAGVCVYACVDAHN